MSLNYCLSISDLDPEDAADVRALVRANNGDEAAGVQAYIDGLLGDMEDIRAQVGGDTLNQADQPLYVVHNLSAENLKHVVDLGGLAAPSLAIARGDIGFNNFGEISLIGAPDMANPKGRGVKAFNADVYSPRQPRPEFTLDQKQVRVLEEKLGPAADTLQERFDFTDEMMREGLEPVAASDVTKLAYLQEIGDAPRIRYKKPPTVPEAYRKFKGIKEHWVLSGDPEFIAAVAENAETHIASLREEVRDKARARLFDENGEPWHNVVMNDARTLAEAYGPRQVDIYETRRAIYHRIEKSAKRRKEYRQWVDDNFSGVLNAKFLRTDSGRRRPYTLENVVREMTRTVRDGEGFNYGLGSIRSNVAHEFKSAKAVRDARENIVDSDAFAAIKEEAETEFMALAEKFAPLHSSGKDFGWLDIFSEFMKDLSNGRLREWQSDIFNEPAPDDLIKEARAFLGKLTDMPTEYFEIKMQRPVQLSEFEAALVPLGTDQATIKTLKDAGLKVVKYQKDDDGNGRIQALQKIGKDVFFQPAFHGSPHIFDKFSTEAMGTGEGAQAFGWGMYFADKKKVAELYRRELSSSRLISPSGEIMGGDTVGQFEELVSAMEAFASEQGIDIEPENDAGILGVVSLSDIVEDWYDMPQGTSLKEGADAFVADRTREEFLDSKQGLWSDVEVKQYIRNVEKTADAFRAMEDGGWKISEGRLYKVDVPEDSDLLAWDKPLSEQPQKVQEKLASLGIGSMTPDDLRAAADRRDAIIEQMGEMASDRDPKTNRMREEDKWHELAGERDELIERIQNADLTGEQAYYDLAKKLVGATEDQGWAQIGGRNKGGDRAASLALRDAGIPGHRFLDGGSRSAGDGSYNYVIYDDDAVAITEYEQDARKGGPRGSIEFPGKSMQSGTTIINLFEGADLSTVIHESGHFFLQAFTELASRPDAPDGMKQDLATLHEWTGHKGGSYGVDAQEKFARGFERYVMEGKAPSMELADAFARFKAWLVRIYKTVRGLDVNLTDEVREVMDRMIATDEEIEAARADMNMSPLFTDAKVAGMSDAEFKPYQRMAQRGKETADQKLLEKTMAKIRREKTAWYKDERKAMVAEVTSEADSRREYRLVNLMSATGVEPDLRLDRQALIDQFGEGVIPELSRTRFGGKRAIYGTGENTLTPQEAAEWFGFESPAEMISILQNAPKRSDYINMEVERRMMERYGDPLNDGSIEEEALVAIHSEHQAHTVAAEARQLAKRAGKPHVNITARVFRARAKGMLGRMQVRNAARPGQFLQAERKAARDAQRAFADIAAGRGDQKAALEKARKFKEQQLLNHYLYMEARDLEQTVRKGREKMRAYDKKSVREKLAGDYIEQIDQILADYQFKQISQREVDRRVSLQDYIDRMIADGREGELSLDDRLVDNARRVHFSRMTVDELQGLFDTIANIDHMGRFKQKLLDKQGERELQVVLDDVTDAIDANIKARPPARFEDDAEAKRKDFRDYLNWTLNADTLLREIDGYEDLGKTWAHIKEPIDTAMNRFVERRQKMADDFDKLYSVYTLAEQRDMNNKRHVEGVGLMSKWNAISVALNTGNEQNYDRLINAGKHALTPDQIETILDTLDERDFRFVESMRGYIGSFWDEIAAKEKRQTGVEPKKVEAREMATVRYSWQRGGYYPIKYDNRLSGLADDRQQQELADSLMGGAFGKAQTRNGHTKARAETTGQPLHLDMSIAHQHVMQVLYDLELGEPLNNAWKIITHSQVKGKFMDVGRKSDHEALELWVKDSANGESVAARGAEKFMRHIRSGFTISRLAVNISTALIQPSGLLQTAVQIGKRDMLTGFISYMSKPAGWSKDILEASPMMRERQKTFERDIFNVVGDVSSKPITGRFDKFMRDWGLPASFILMQKVQFYAVDAPTWVAAYEQELKRSGDETRARTHADSMVKRAQGSGLMTDRGMLERGTTAPESRQREFPRMLTALGSYMFAKFNVAYERTGNTDFKDPLQVMNLAIDMALLFTMEAFLYSLVKGGLPDDEEDESWLAWIASNTALSAMSTLPIMRELSGALSGFGGGGIFGSSIETLSRPMIQATQGEFDKALVTSTMNFMGVMLHLPASQMNTIINGLFDDDMGVKRDIEPMDVFIRRYD